MNRGIVKVCIIVAVSVGILFLTYTLLYGDSGDSKHYSRPVTPEMPSRETGTNTLEKAGERSFSDQFLPSPDKLTALTPRSLVRKRADESNMPQYIPDSRIHYFILEMKVRQDIDFKINRPGRIGR